ncbi:MAG TPA: N-acetyltransferase [Gammaproteobacteria bacterium]|jgi:predicted GNAT family acetyltransferase|nr:N-acetyltransferase [Gammaproteobacteria bacterium]
MTNEPTQTVIPSLVVVHDQETQQFVIDLGDAPAAYVRYTLSDDNSFVDFVTTFVPDSHRGQGLAERLVNAAFVWADNAKLQVKTSCWYAELKYQRWSKEADARSDV